MQLQYLMTIENVLGKAPILICNFFDCVCDVIPIVFTFFLQAPEQKLQVERDYTGTKHIPIFVMLPVSIVYSLIRFSPSRERDRPCSREFATLGVCVVEHYI